MAAGTTTPGAIPGCTQAPASGQIHTLDELIAWPAAELAKLTCGDFSRALPGSKYSTFDSFAKALGPDQQKVVGDVVLGPAKAALNTSIVDKVGSAIGNAIGLNDALTGVLNVVLLAVFVLGGLGIIALGLNRLTGGGVTRTATKGAALAAV